MFGSGKQCIPPLSGSRHGALLVGESAAREAFCLSLITGCADALWFGRPVGACQSRGRQTVLCLRCEPLACRVARFCPQIALTPCFLGCSKADPRATTEPSSLLAA